jgi:glycosyltransferase involved in cell wall biosynthesis
MNILYVITSLEGGGAQKLLVDLCGALKEKHQITVAFLKNSVTYEPELKAMGIPPVLVDIDKLGFMKTVRALRKLIISKHIDIVHTHLPSADTVGRIAGLRSKAGKVISSIHNEDQWKSEKTLKTRALLLFNRITVNRFKRVSLISVSQSVKDYCVKMDRIRADKITVIYNFMRVQELEKRSADFVPLAWQKDSYVLIIVARLEPNKGHLLLLNALKRIPEDKKVALMILGTGSEQEKIEQFIDENRMSQVKMLGFRPNIYDYIRAADCFVLPSQNEGQSVAVLESYYCKTPVLASDISANRELLQGGKNGVLFKLDDAEDLAAKITALVDGKYDTQQLTANASAFCQTLSIERHLAKLEAIYQGA